MTLNEEKCYKRLVRALKRIRSISNEVEGMSCELDSEKVYGLLTDVRTTAERALEGVKFEQRMSQIEIERKKFRDRWGMTYRRAEQFWYREAMSQRKIDEELAMAIIHHATLEEKFSEERENNK